MSRRLIVREDALHPPGGLRHQASQEAAAGLLPPHHPGSVVTITFYFSYEIALIFIQKFYFLFYKGDLTRNVTYIDKDMITHTYLFIYYSIISG